ncbi:tectonin beta-propeller repeat-containing protein 1-like isoform X2 [Tachypleus tridentatus]|uniref:tectonin beta-propeller repeat-containing protein 1-like isoform X2 n=1 Tax=Tachypleus tridentatus TaxID=6853 RepID=UPI003FD32728
MANHWGWMYAVDFPRHYFPEKHWNSLVRRRKWIRCRCYSAVDRWAQISSIHGDPVEEPFIDVSVGGSEIPGGDPDILAVWAVTVLGRVMFRYGVRTVAPEGQGWIHITTPAGCEVNQISVGPTGLVWAVLWDGCTIVRTGVTRENIRGNNWVRVDSPSGNEKLLQVSVGTSTVWSVSRVGKVWFRKGVNGQKSGIDCISATGTGWVEMVGEMTIVSVGHYDQVWALGRDDRIPYFRMGVTCAELSGKIWKPINLSFFSQLSHGSSHSSLMSQQSLQLHYEIGRDHVPSDQEVKLSDKSQQNTINYTTKNSYQTRTEEDVSFTETYKGHSTTLSFVHPPSVSGKKNVDDSISQTDSGISVTTSGNPSAILLTPSEKTLEKPFKGRLSREHSSSSDVSDTVRDFVYDVSDDEEEGNKTELISVNNAQKNYEQKQVGLTNTEDGIVNMNKDDHELAGEFSELSVIVQDDTSSQLKHPDNLSGTIIENDDFSIPEHASDETVDDYSSNYLNMEIDISWVWLSASGCVVDPQVLPPWFDQASTFQDSNMNKQWRKDILSQFHDRFRKEVSEFMSYPQAVEKSAWVKTGSCKLWSNVCPSQWFNTHLELEQKGTDQKLDSAELTCYYITKKKKKLVINLEEVTAVVNVSNFKRRLLVIHTTQNMPVKFIFQSDQELEDWLATLNQACTDISSLLGRPSISAVWSTTFKGDIYVHNAEETGETGSCSQKLWRLLGGGHLNIVETCTAGVVWGLSYDNSVWIYTGGYGGGIFKGRSGCSLNVHQMTDTRCFYVYENQRWNPLTGFSARGLPTDRYMWSDRSGQFECTKENTKLPTSHWQWISDWVVDFRTPGGTDREGWQYAYDFPFSYHYYKSFTDYVRRRRWCRKCKLTTSGPWWELTTTPLIDVSIQVDHSNTVDKPIALWAVAQNGDVLCRIGVTAVVPEGISWLHVPADEPFQAISVGGYFRVWGITKKGSAMLRNDVSEHCPTGQVWFHVEPPQTSVPLKQISVGKTSVFAVDEEKTLWFRKDIIPVFPEGTCWKKVSSKIRMVSVGPQDQVWVVADEVQTPMGLMNGVVLQRDGISESNKMGTGWSIKIGGGWHYVSIRGCL